MDGRGRRGTGTAGPRIKEIREVAPDTYRVVIENPDGSEETITATRHGDLIETPYGAYPVPPPPPPSEDTTAPSPAHTTPAQSPSPQPWLVEENPRGTLRARIPLRVAEAHAAPGQQVEKGQPILVVETMKMLHEVTAPCTGTVEEIAQSGSTAQRGQVLARIRCSD